MRIKFLLTPAVAGIVRRLAESAGLAPDVLCRRFVEDAVATAGCVLQTALAAKDFAGEPVILGALREAVMDKAAPEARLAVGAVLDMAFGVEDDGSGQN